jgi:hypothetical protein
MEYNKFEMYAAAKFLPQFRLVPAGSVKVLAKFWQSSCTVSAQFQQSSSKFWQIPTGSDIVSARFSAIVQLVQKICLLTSNKFWQSSCKFLPISSGKVPVRFRHPPQKFL